MDLAECSRFFHWMSLPPDWLSVQQEWPHISDDERARYATKLDGLALTFAKDVNERYLLHLASII
jgi:hypothetical protein